MKPETFGSVDSVIGPAAQPSFPETLTNVTGPEKLPIARWVEKVPDATPFFVSVALIEKSPLPAVPEPTILSPFGLACAAGAKISAAPSACRKPLVSYSCALLWTNVPYAFDQPAHT